jgi:hypothetical protein
MANGRNGPIMKGGRITMLASALSAFRKKFTSQTSFMYSKEAAMAFWEPVKRLALFDQGKHTQSSFLNVIKWARGDGA